ncbi:hypothetical protein G7068_15090 [Leucobacter viscericola]|uniref:SipW-cognate class signal peptide n=1 Tax=Leucobacter viscericola TaxID=2714935 RepID=A0A6G7XIL0_9MICO|nr:hypothetical protein [Leucobacter viscericola]QIK64383.1 hypothetical protein G7068_15090 [Leucobacter viscericola]
MSHQSRCSPRGQHGLRIRNEPRFSRTRTLAISTLSTGVAAALAVSMAGGTYAWLNARTTAPGATLRSGSFELLIDGAGSTVLDPFTASPLSPAARPFSVTNSGDTPAKLTAVATTNSAPTLLDHTTARLTPVANKASCVVGSTAPNASLRGFATPPDFFTLPAASTQWFCFELGITPNPPETASGQEISFALTITGDQGGS